MIAVLRKLQDVLQLKNCTLCKTFLDVCWLWLEHIGAESCLSPTVQSGYSLTYKYNNGELIQFILLFVIEFFWGGFRFSRMLFANYKLLQYKLASLESILFLTLCP